MLAATMMTFALSSLAQVGKGGITPEMLSTMRKSHPMTASDRALRNALAGTSINQLARTPRMVMLRTRTLVTKCLQRALPTRRVRVVAGSSRD